MARDKVINGYGNTVSIITIYNLFNLVTNDKRKCFTEGIRRIITFLHIVSRET